MPTSVSKCRRTFRKLLISVFASFFLNANIVCADTRTFNYEVRWQFVTVGTIELNLVRSPEKNSISLSAETKGLFKFLRAKEAGVKKGTLVPICPPDVSSTSGQPLRSVCLKWAYDHPEALDHPASGLVLNAFSEAWPCE